MSGWRVAKLAFEWTALVVLLGYLAMRALLWFAFERPDPFTDGLVIPRGLAVANPLPESAEFSPVSVGVVASLELRKGMQPGIYSAAVRGNPGEPGTTYLKAFEVTRGTALSADDVKRETTRRVALGQNSSEGFVSETEFTIYEGDWGYPYAARFEAWFIPDSGQPERKLVERVYRIEGWQR